MYGKKDILYSALSPTVLCVVRTKLREMVNIQQDLGRCDKIQSGSGARRSCGAGRRGKRGIVIPDRCDKGGKQWI